MVAKMKILLIIACVMLGSNAAKNLISSHEFKELFKKIISNDLTQKQRAIWNDLLEIFRSPEFLTLEQLSFSGEVPLIIQCILCTPFFGAVFYFVRIGFTDETLIKSLSFLCITFGIENENVCYGIIKKNVPIMSYIVRTTPEATAKTFCFMLLQTEVGNECSRFWTFSDTRFEWQVKLPPVKTSTSRKTKSTTTKTRKPMTTATKPLECTLKVAVITDIHVDPHYEPFGVANCDEPICCRKGQKPAKLSFSRSNKNNKGDIARISAWEKAVVFSHGKYSIDLSMAKKLRNIENQRKSKEIQKSSKKPAGYWGDYRSCDTPTWVFDNVLDTIHDNHKDIDVIYYIGDTIDQAFWHTTSAKIHNTTKYVVDKFRRTFCTKIPIVPVVGNHDTLPANQISPVREKGPFNTSWIYRNLANEWSDYLTPKSKKSIQQRGQYSVMVKPDLRVIVLNSNVANRFNWWLLYDPTEPKLHLDWLVNELYEAEKAGESVHILSHIPPGYEDLIYTWTREYNRIINRFSSIIKAEFNGHTHSDEFKVFYNKDGNPINVAWNAGGVATYFDNNVNYKIFSFDQKTYEPIRMETYIYNLTRANLTPKKKPVWFQLYEFNTVFGLRNMSANSIHNLVQSMVNHKKYYLDLYSQFFTKMSDTTLNNCDVQCKLDILCKTVTTVLWDRKRCEQLKHLYLT